MTTHISHVSCSHPQHNSLSMHIDMHYIPCTIPTPLPFTTFLRTQERWGLVGTICRNGVKVFWCHSHLAWLGFEGSIPTCTWNPFGLYYSVDNQWNSGLHTEQICNLVTVLLYQLSLHHTTYILQWPSKYPQLFRSRKACLLNVTFTNCLN